MRPTEPSTLTLLTVPGWQERSEVRLLEVLHALLLLLLVLVWQHLLLLLVVAEPVLDLG